MPRRSFLLLLPACVAVAVLAGCAGTAPRAPAADASPSIAHTLIYVVHGDGDYLFHRDGEPIRANRRIVEQAKSIARSAPQTEVFIFHQRPQKRTLGLFARTDGTLLHYRNGVLVGSERYHRDPRGLSAEAELFHARAAPGVSGRSLLYFGHDIPEQPGVRYHASHPDAAFDVDAFADGLRAFDAAEDPFDLLVLSACNNGSPGTIAAVAPYARYVLASPGDLHLSHIDTHPLHRIGTHSGSIAELSEELSEWAFTRLAERTRTGVALSLFDTAALTPVLPSLERAYSEQRTSSGRALPPADFVDCADGAMPVLAADVPGVRRWYRPPAFGRDSGKQSHSGWGCPRAP